MKKILIATIALGICTTAFGAKKSVEKILIGGSGWDSIAIIDKATKTIEWSMAIPRGGETNNVCMTRKGEILFAYGRGARLVDRSGKTIWDYPVTNPKAEMHTARQLPNGNYLLASCDTPMRIIELDRKGRQIKEVTFDLGIPNAHSQFRGVSKAKNGNYLIPTFGKSNIFEITPNGELVRTYEGLKSAYSLLELSNGDLLVSSGDSHQMVVVDRKTGEIKTEVSENDIEGVTLKFVGTAHRLPGGNTIIANWSGHSRGKIEPQIVEFDADKKLIWSYDGYPRVKFISTIYPFTE